MRSTSTVLGNYSADIFSVNNLKPSLLLEEVNSYRDYRFYYLPRYRNGDVMCIITNPKQKPFPLSLPAGLADYLFPEEGSELRTDLENLSISVLSEQLLHLEESRKLFSALHTEGEIGAYFYKQHRKAEDPWDQYMLLQVSNLFNPRSASEIPNLRAILERVFQELEARTNPLPESLGELLGEEVPYVYRTPNLNNFAGSDLRNGERKVYVHINFRELLAPGVPDMFADFSRGDMLPFFQEVYGSAVKEVSHIEGSHMIEMVLVYPSHEDWHEIMNAGRVPLGWILSSTVPSSRQFSPAQVLELWKASKHPELSED